MIRFFAIVGLAVVLISAYLTTLAVGPESQLPPPVSLLEKFREEGILPAAVNLKENEAAEEGIFEVPEMDEMMLQQALNAIGDMPGMNMDMGRGDTVVMESMNMADGSGMDMVADDTPSMDGMNMADGSGMNMGGDDTPAMDGMNMANGSGMNMTDGSGMNMGRDSLLITEDGDYDREIELIMSEWSFSEMKIEVNVGERIKFTVRNGGQIPHEFMFMDMPLMQAVDYRDQRADWSLFEHEALFEKSLVLPGGDFSFVLQANKPGTWMFMCMLPYHMQMGMMAQLSTPGMGMRMGMKM